MRSSSFSFLMLSATFTVEADALAGLGELVFQLGAVGDEDHLPLRELTDAGTSPAP